MCIAHQNGNLRGDKTNHQALLLRNNIIADTIQDEFAREMNRLVHEEVRRCCDACQRDCPSQDNHDCKTMEEEGIWACHFEKAKTRFDVQRFWKRVRKAVFVKLGFSRLESWTNYLCCLLLMDHTSSFLIYKNYERKQNENRN